jgi:hypothetical protein
MKFSEIDSNTPNIELAQLPVQSETKSVSPVKIPYSLNKQSIFYNNIVDN